MATTKQILHADTIRVIKDAVTYELLPAEEGGYVVTVIDYPSCSSQGETIDEALANAEDALYGCLLVDKDAGLPIPHTLAPFLERMAQRPDEQDQNPSSHRANPGA